MKLKVDRLYIIVALLIISFATFYFIGKSKGKKLSELVPPVIIKVDESITDNKIGERETIIKIHKLPPDSVATLLNIYYKDD